MTGSFRAETMGNRGQKYRGLEARIERDTFLRYSRFVQEGNLPYAANAQIMADLYVGGDLNLDGFPVTMWGDVAVGNVINNQANGIFHGNITGTGAGIDIQQSVDMDYYRNLSQGLVPGEGTGLYLAGATTINLDLFDFSVPGAATYNGSPIPPDFNGVIFCEEDIGLKGFLEGGYVNHKSEPVTGITFVSNDDIVARGDIRTGSSLTDVDQAGTMNFDSPTGQLETKSIPLDGHVDTETNAVRLNASGTTWDKMQITILEDGSPMVRPDGKAVRTQLVRTSTSSEDNQTAVINGNDLNGMEFDSGSSYSIQIDYYSTGTGNTSVDVAACKGEPVNIGLVTKNQFFVHQNTSKQTTIDAAILSRDNNWNGLGESADHPDGFDSGVWELTVNGPIITKLGGSAGPWASNGTRYYRYDMDMVDHAPPAFPVPAEWWKLAYMKHLKEDESEL